MKIILLEDVKTLGKKGDIVDVSDGYARNALLPKRLGVEANSKNMNDLKLKKANEEKVAKEQYDAAVTFAEGMTDDVITLTMKAGEGGKAFGSISAKEIAEEYKKQLGKEIDKKKLLIREPIKSFGTFEVPVKLHPKVTGTLRVKVTEE
ncbi:MAG: 50S ribosomal protein L9 [Lachnospiraceae bacterium]|nr:50S ribosomal protein L9 [Lachnospiraceae bacterium]